MNEEIIKIRCLECKQLRYINKMVWDEDKICKCNCGSTRFKEIIEETK